MRPRLSRQSLGQIFAAPALVALMSMAGLIAALVGDGLWDWLSSACLAVPAITLCACMGRGRGRGGT